jgi:Tfp pilus assembly protein FimT
MKAIAIALVAILAVFATPAEAKGGGNKRANEQAKKKEAEKKKEREEREARRDKIEAFMKDRDGNKDGSLTKDEFISGETDKTEGGKKFDEYNKNKDRYLSKSEIQNLLGL